MLLSPTRATSSGFLRPSIGAPAPSRFATFPLISRTARWSSVPGRTTAPSSSWCWSLTSLAVTTTHRAASGTSCLCLAARMKTQMTPPTWTSRTTLWSDASRCSIPSTSSSRAFSLPLWRFWSSTCHQTVGRRWLCASLCFLPSLSFSYWSPKLFHPPRWLCRSLASTWCSPWCWWPSPLSQVYVC